MNTVPLSSRLSPPVTAVRGVIAALWRVLQPYYAAGAARSDQLVYSYREFLSEEVKRKWEWKRRTEQERAFWDDAVTFALGALPACAYTSGHLCCS